MKYFELTKEEQEILEEVERGEFRSVENLEQAKKDAIAAARNTLAKTKNINIRLSEKDLQCIKALAAEKGLPYQTFISSLLHQFSNKGMVLRDQGNESYKAS